MLVLLKKQLDISYSHPWHHLNCTVYIHLKFDLRYFKTKSVNSSRVKGKKESHTIWIRFNCISTESNSKSIPSINQALL